MNISRSDLQKQLLKNGDFWKQFRIGRLKNNGYSSIGVVRCLMINQELTVISGRTKELIDSYGFFNSASGKLFL